ncbi:DUF4429 domain-containing protein [Listeria sp. SHR_NRA_18]|uniref:DUF4429 domain-containing protein n=1 Tax=Listeria sp. SHR_NRA_18 TaxID=2269046 RepID=UPI000F5E1914|nr:DUF4429 domain-containing protein [Listeria sp. SHR_NRA_18]RQW65991.1 DUF4429 domain-containing protein [Listeria sp. SHR_NRA_18]
MVDWKALAKKSMEKSTEIAKQSIDKSIERSDEKKKMKFKKAQEEKAFEEKVLSESSRSQDLKLKGKKKKQILAEEHQRNQQIKNNQFLFEKPAKTQVIIDEHFIRITRKGAMNKINVGSSGEKAIKISNINSVQLKEPGMTSGYIQFTLSGNSNSQGILDAVKDENSIIFLKEDSDKANIIKNIIEQRITKDSASVLINQQTLSPAEELRKYKELFDEGVLTEEEFIHKKKQILDM